MAQLTKQAIIQSFMQMLSEKPFDKITVTDIVDRCGVNRNTFYYYFSDIYDLVDELLMTETRKIVDKHKEYDTWQEGFLEATKFARDNKKAVYHLYNSVSRDRLDRYLYDVINLNMTRFVKKQAVGLDADPDDIEVLSAFYTAALTGLVNKWLSDGMRYDPNPLIERLGVLLDGNLKTSLGKRKPGGA